MSIAEKLQTIAENEQRVFEAGKEAEWSEFWDYYQNNGTKTQYPNAFFAWPEKVYKPKYPIFMDNSSTGAFNWSQITDTIVDIELGAKADVSFMFSNCYYLVTVSKLIVTPTAKFDYAFNNCTALENITIEGVIGTNFNIISSPLTVESAKSIINALKNYAETDKKYLYTLYFASDVWTRLEADSTAPNGGTWQDYVVYNLGWNI